MVRGQTGRRGFMIGSGLTMLGWSAAEARSAVIQTKDGALEGVSTAVPGVTAWLGIPYAAPPVGPLRWRPPQPVRAWKGVRRADHFGHSPYAPSSFSSDTDSAFTPADMSEDCLTLNVWALPRRRTLRPVMVWIYGGAFIMGTSADPHYNGTALAAEDVVVVSLNYRVGILGSFAHPELARESPRGVSGNYGLMDQIAALRWVRDNIEAFGGDPDNITIFGQSAGAFSVAYHLVMPQSRGLFHRAIAQSGAPLGRPDSEILLGRLPEMQQAGAAFGRRIGQPDLVGLRSLPPETLIKEYGFSWQFYPVIDGFLVPEHPFRMLAAGNCARVPVMAGHNHDEGSLFPPIGNGTASGLRKAVHQIYGSEAGRVLSLMQAEPGVTPTTMGRDVFGDLVFNWNSIVLVMMMARVSTGYAYRFDYRYALPAVWGAKSATAAPPGYAFHGAEIGFVFKTQPIWSERQHEQEDLMRRMSGYWLNFARNGDPNGAGLPQWPSYRPGQRQLFRLDERPPELVPIENYDRLVLLGKAMDNRVLEQG